MDFQQTRVTRRRALGLVGAGVVGVAGASSVGGYAVGRTQERRHVQAVTAAANASTPATAPVFTTLVNQPGQPPATSSSPTWATPRPP